VGLLRSDFLLSCFVIKRALSFERRCVNEFGKPESIAFPPSRCEETRNADTIAREPITNSSCERVKAGLVSA